jgi:cupin 2 domain-containing protein
MIAPSNLFAGLEAHPQPSGEVLETLFASESVKIERIVSHSAASPDGFWYDQAHDEWILVLRGEAVLQLGSGDHVHLKTGDHLLIPKHCKHRVEQTSEETIWLAVHMLCPEP